MTPSTQIQLDGVTYQVDQLSPDIQHFVVMMDMVSHQLTVAQLEVLKCESAIEMLREALRANLAPG